jgi:hypothetical protein
MKKILLLIFCSCALYAQAQVKGKITDEKGQPLPGTIIRLFSGPGLQKTTLTDTTGFFSSNLPNITYLIINSMGFRPDTIKAPGKSTGLIRLKPLVSQLKEVRIQGRLALIRQETDRSVISVNEQVSKLAANALEIIALAPGITLSDNEDAILMSGKSDVQIMINDKLVKMTARDLAKMLKAMPADNIKKIEFMTNPPVKYEVNGNSGIINIKTNGVVKGITGSMDYSTSQSSYNWTDLSALLNYGTGRLAVSGYLAWHRGGYLTENDKVRQLWPGILNQQTNSLDKWSDPVFRVAIDFSAGRNSTLGGTNEREASTNTSSYNTYSSQENRNFNTSSENPNTRHWNTYNLNYRYSDTLGTELTIDLDRADFKKDSQIMLATTDQPPINYLTSTGISINTFKADYTHNWKNKLKVEAGLKIAAVKTNNSQDKNLFHYTENIRAAYAGLSGSNQKWGWQLGLRVEQTEAKGKTQQVSRPDTSYINLLPSAYLTWAPDTKNHFRLSLSRRIKRPDYNSLQPFVYVLDPLNEQTGNPGLLVQRNNQIELTYTINNRVSLVGNYSLADDYFSTLYRQSGEILIEIPANSGRMHAFNLDLNYPSKVTKWWNMLNKVNTGNDHFSGALFQGQLNQNKWRYQLSTTQRFIIHGSYQLQLSGRYTSASQNLIYRQRSSANISASIGRKFFKEQASVRLGISDIFKTQRNYTDVNFGSLVYTDLERFESRRLSFNFSCRFGNTKARQTKERSSGSVDEKSRGSS